MGKHEISVFGGALVRHARDDWRWRDGTPEPRVADLSPSIAFNFRVRAGEFVEVLLSKVHADRETLGWVLSGVESGEYRQCYSGDHSGPLMLTDEGIQRMRIEPGEDPLLGNEPITHKRAIPRVALVPVEDWDKWADEHPYGATWEFSDQDDIVKLAEEKKGLQNEENDRN